MVNEQADVKVTLNGDEAKRELDTINNRIENLIELKKKAEAEGDVKGFKKIDTELKKAQKEAKRYEQQMYDVDKALRNINGASFNDLRKAELALVTQTKSLNRETEAYTKKSAQLKLVRAEMKKIRSEQRASTSAWGRMASGVKQYIGLATGLLASIAGITYKANQAINSFMERQDMLGKVKALTRLSGEELAFLEQKAIQFAGSVDKSGVRIQKSADDILNAFQLVGSAKPELLKDKEALAEVTRQVLILSEAAEGMPLADAIDATTKAMNQYNAPAEQAARFTNAMAAGAQVGAVQIPQIGESIKEFGTNAKAANVPIERSVGLIELVGEKAGVVGPRAGIQIRNFFSILSAGADDTNPEIVGLTESLDNLGKKNLTSAQYSKIFGRENANVARIIVQNRKYLDELTTAMTGTNTATQQAIDNTSDEIAKQKQAKERAHEYAVELGQRLVPAKTGLINASGFLIKILAESVKLFVQSKGVIIPLTASVLGYTAAVRVASLWKKNDNKQSVISIALSKAKVMWNNLEKGGIILLAGAQALLTGNVRRATAAMRLFNITTKLSPIGLLIGLVTAAASAFLIFRNKSDDATESQKDFNDELDRTNELMGQKQYVQFLREIGYMKDEMITLADGSQRMITVFDDGIDVLDKFGKKVKTLKEGELENFKRFFETELVNMQRSMQNLDPNDILYQTEQSRVEQYQKALDQVNKELDKYAEIRKGLSGGGGTDDSSMKDALAALEEANKERTIKIKEQYANEQITADEFHAHMLTAEMAYLIQKKAILQQFGQDLDEVNNQILDKRIAMNQAISSVLKEGDKELTDEIQAEIDAVHAQAENAIQITKKAITSLDESAKEEKNIAEQRKNTYMELATMMGNSFSQMLTDQELSAKAFFKNFILMALEALHKFLWIKKAEVMIAEAAKVATGQFWAVAKAVAEIAVMEAAFAAAKAAISGGFKTSNRASQHATGKYPVTGATDGRTYDANYAGRPKTGIYSGPQLGLFNEDPQHPEMVVDGRTTRQLMVNYPAVYQGIRQLASGATPQFADGKYPVSQNQASTSSKTDQDIASVLSRATDVLDNIQKKGVRGYFPKYGTGGLQDAIDDLNNFNSNK